MLIQLILTVVAPILATSDRAMVNIRILRMLLIMASQISSLGECSIAYDTTRPSQVSTRHRHRQRRRYGWTTYGDGSRCVHGRQQGGRGAISHIPIATARSESPACKQTNLGAASYRRPLIRHPISGVQKKKNLPVPNPCKIHAVGIVGRAWRTN